MHQTKPALFVLLLLLLGGTIGFHLIEGWPVLDSLYMTIITLSTVGFRELAPLSPQGKIFTSALIILGVGTLAYALTSTVETLIERGLLLQRRRVHMGIKRLSDHVIVCGYGRMGRTVAEQLRARGQPIVLVEKEPLAAEQVEQQGFFQVVGDATEDGVLVEAGVERAKALATVLSHDADNLFVTLSARNLNPKLIIIARASNEKNEAKMIAAGATRVLNPYRSGGRLMVRQLLQPSVTEFIASIEEFTEAEVCLEEIQVQAGSTLAGTMLKDSPIKRELNLLVIGVRRGGRTVFNPAIDLAPEAGDTLLVLGRLDNLRRLERLAMGSG